MNNEIAMQSMHAILFDKNKNKNKLKDATQVDVRNVG